jgi:predicted Zn-dependent protease
MKSLLLGALLLLTTAQGVNFFSLKQDIEIGAVSAREAEQALPLLRDPHLNRYLRSIGQRISRSPSLPSLQYRFRIVNSRDLDSLGFPGGAIYLHRGLIELTSSDDEVAALLAHEIGHVAARHGTAQLSRQLLVQAPISIATGLPTMEAWRDQLTTLGISFGIDAPFVRYGNDQELEAGLMAVRLLTEARFDANGLRTLLEKVNEIQTPDGAPPPAFVFNHPQSESLWLEVADEIARLEAPAHRKASASAEFRAFHAALSKRAYPALDKEAEPEPNDAISGMFIHPQDYYRLGYPPGWQVTRTPPNGAIITPEDGVQQYFAGDEITHGVMFDLFDVSAPDRALTLEQATNRLIVFLRQRNQSLRIIPGAQTQALVGDEPGLRTIMIGRSMSTNSPEVVWVVTRTYYQSLFYMVFVAPEDEFPKYQPVFEQIIRSVRLR